MTAYAFTVRSRSPSTIVSPIDRPDLALEASVRHLCAAEGVVAVDDVGEAMVTPDQLTDPDTIDLFRRIGFVVIPHVLSPSECDELVATIDTRLAALRPMFDLDRSVDVDGVLVNTGEQLLTSHQELTAHPEPVVHVRDEFIDVFHIDRLLPSVEALGERLHTSALCRLAEAAFGVALTPRSLNLYLTESLADPRCLHVDSMSRLTFKAFTFLADVGPGDGPYRILPGSHNATQLRALNRELNEALGRKRTDIELFDADKLFACEVAAGTTVLSVQTGAHGGTPQLPGHRRLALVRQFAPAG